MTNITIYHVANLLIEEGYLISIVMNKYNGMKIKATLNGEHVMNIKLGDCGIDMKEGEQNCLIQFAKAPKMFLIKYNRKFYDIYFLLAYVGVHSLNYMREIFKDFRFFKENPVGQSGKFIGGRGLKNGKFKLLIQDGYNNTVEIGSFGVSKDEKIRVCPVISKNGVGALKCLFGDSEVKVQKFNVENYPNLFITQEGL